MGKERYLERADQVLRIEIEALEAIRGKLGENFVALVESCMETLDAGGKLVLCGVGKSGHIGQKLAATLSSTGSPAAFLHPVEAMHGDLGIVSAGDLLLALSYSGETDELLSMLPAVKRLGLKVIAITGMADSRLARWSDLTLDMGVPREACPFNLAPTATTTALLALGDTLAMVLLDARGFGKTDYAKYHPAGAIGRSVTLSVTDIMRTGDRFPQVAPEVSVREALLAMTKARSGSVAVVDEQGRLFGIFTDGDFRRQVTDDGDVLKKTVGIACTPDPITVNRSKMAVDVLKVVEQRNIDDVIVVDDEGRPLGLVDVQDLPSFKLM
jgi:arabinose-5-phosphate isomerase